MEYNNSYKLKKINDFMGKTKEGLPVVSVETMETYSRDIRVNADSSMVKELLCS